MGIGLRHSKNRIDHNYFKGKTHQGTMLVVWLNGEPAEHRIDHNYFGPRPDRKKNGAETIRIGTSEWWRTNARTIVEDNYFYGCDGEVEIISNKSCENIYRRNTFVECAGTLTLRHGDRASVYGNFFFGNGKRRTGGVRIIGEGHLVYNNYFQDLTGDEDVFRSTVHAGSSKFGGQRLHAGEERRDRSQYIRE
jgi:poly(beta-D-mannuronate) lyase